MKPVIALVGRPNVGKSTLFNRLTGTRDAIVADFAGLTRDRHYGKGRAGAQEYIVIDTGGFEPDAAEGIYREMAKQTPQAVAESDVVIFVVDARAGISAQDHEIAQYLRRLSKPTVLVANKAEGMTQGVQLVEFFELGLGELMPVSGAHGQGVRSMLEAALQAVPGLVEEDEEEAQADAGVIRLAVAGRPNVGKSTLINVWLGEERLVAFDLPGTTRDAISVPFERDGKRFELIDTAGLRRKGKVFEAIEKFSVVKTLQAIEQCNVAILLLDGGAEIADQDAHIAGYILESGRALVVAVNKWDGIPSEQRDEIRRQLEVKLDFVPYAPVDFISARHGTGVGELVAATIHAYDAAMTEIPTARLTQTLEWAMQRHQPPLIRGRRIKLRYAHQGGRNPPRIIIHGNQTSQVPDAYTRYLANVFRKEFELFASPVAIEYRSSSNPYAPADQRPSVLKSRELTKQKSKPRGRAQGPRKRG